MIEKNDIRVVLIGIADISNSVGEIADIRNSNIFEYSRIPDGYKFGIGKWLHDAFWDGYTFALRNGYSPDGYKCERLLTLLFSLWWLL
jgi:hypothetical protein